MENPKLTRAVATVAAALVLVPAAPAVAEGSYEAGEPALALVRPATMYVQATYTGTVRDRVTGVALTADPVVHRRRCSAVVVNPAGYALTAGSCVRPTPDVLLVNALNEVGKLLVARGELTSGEVASFVAERTSTTEYTAVQRGRPPAVTLAAWSAGHVDGETGSVPAAVTYAQPPGEGNVAVVRVEAAGLPAVEISRATPPTAGTTLVVAGYLTDPKSSAYLLRARTVTVAGRGGTNRLTLDGGIGPLARGGPVVDGSGRLVALQDTDPSVPGEPVRDLIIVEHIERALAAAGVTNALSDADRAYRDALTDYFAGRFSVAVRKFDALLAAAPSYGPAQGYRARAVARRDVDGDAVADAGRWPHYGLSAVAGAAVIAMLHLLLGRLLRRRDRKRAAAVRVPAQRQPSGTTVIPRVTMHDETVTFERPDH